MSSPDHDLGEFKHFPLELAVCVCLSVELVMAVACCFTVSSRPSSQRWSVFDVRLLLTTDYTTVCVSWRHNHRTLTTTLLATCSLCFSRRHLLKTVLSYVRICCACPACCCCCCCASWSASHLTSQPSESYQWSKRRRERGERAPFSAKTFAFLCLPLPLDSISSSLSVAHLDCTWFFRLFFRQDVTRKDDQMNYNDLKFLNLNKN